MSLLQFVVIISAVIFILFGIDLYKRKKMNILHFIVFFVGGSLIVIFAFDMSLLNSFGKFFGIARGADLLVYIGLILLFYFYIDILNKHTKDKFQLTKLISQEAINKAYEDQKNNIKKYNNSDYKDNFVFNIRLFNEEKTIGIVAEEILEAGFNKIIFIDDGSSDGSLEILQSLKQKYSNKLLIIISHTINRGGGAANQTGYNFVKKYGEELKIKRLVGFDADGQMSIKDMNNFIKKIQAEEKTIEESKHKLISDSKFVPTDLYLGSRFVNGGKYDNMPVSRKIILKISKLIVRILYGTKVSDPHNGYRIISLNALKKIDLTADGMHYANELNEQIKKHKMKYLEIPVHIRYTDYSLGKGQKNSNSLKLGIEMIYKKIFFR